MGGSILPLVVEIIIASNAYFWHFNNFRGNENSYIALNMS